MKWRYLSEDVVLLEVEDSQTVSLALVEAEIEQIIDVIPGDQEIAIQFLGNNLEDLIREIAQLRPNSANHGVQEIVIPICYELGLDWEEVCNHTKMEKEQVIEWHLASNYKVNYGFTPGFLYLNGLNEKLYCPRRQDPRTKIPEGSVGIGGGKTGIYSLESPGGWQLIGRTPDKLFDISKEDPFSVPNGARIRFERITIDQYHAS